MFGKKYQVPFKSLIADGCFVEGNLKFTAGLRVDGNVVGNIVADPEHPGILLIGEMAHVTGEVSGTRVVINGQVTGPVYATELLELRPKANIQGDVHYRALEMHQGALITGRLCPLTADEDKAHPAHSGQTGGQDDGQQCADVAAAGEITPGSSAQDG